jgi:large subunit ribosomal protein L32
MMERTLPFGDRLSPGYYFLPMPSPQGKRLGYKDSKMAVSMCAKLVRGITTRIAVFEQRILMNFTAMTFDYTVVPGGCNLGDHHMEERQESDSLLWMAVPKKKTTPSKKKLRHRHKWLKNRTDIETCVVCGNNKLVSHLCGYCLEKINEDTREHRKVNKEDEKHWPIPDILKKFRLY